jgi:hypothetical protein
VIDPPIAREGQRVVDGPDKVGNEHRWRVELPGGERAVLGQLLPEIAEQESVRRRYVNDAERVAALDAPAIAATLAIGPEPDPRKPGAVAPWRLRDDPDGERLSAWLARRAPAPVDEALALVASIADAVHGVHAAGGVLRDLEPRDVLIADGGAVWLVDIGLARVDILSTRTASSLMLESSPYSAPEHLRATVIDQRADVYTLGALLWHALTGEPPFDGGPQLFRSSASLPALTDVAPVGDALAGFVASCLADEPGSRPESARDVAEVLRGRAPSTGTALERVTCQACAAPMRPGLRLCLTCGKQAVQFEHLSTDIDPSQRFSVVLKKAKDDVEFLASLREFFETLGEGPPPELNFLTGDARMYSKEERERLTSLPVPLFTDLEFDAASRLAVRLREHGMTVGVEVSNKIERNRRHSKKVIGASAVGVVAGATALVAGWFVSGGILLGASVIGGVYGLIRLGVNSPKKIKPPMAQLRGAPAALPASDPLVARIAALLDLEALTDDTREVIGELALLIQRLVDHRASLADDSEAAAIIEPVAPLVGLIEREVTAIAEIDTNLRDLDEGTLVRAIAASEARDESADMRGKLLTGLDRLRALEDARAAHLQRLLEASSLVRRTVELGMSTRDAEADSDRGVAMALAALDHDLDA